MFGNPQYFMLSMMLKKALDASDARLNWLLSRTERKLGMKLTEMLPDIFQLRLPDAPPSFILAIERQDHDVLHVRTNILTRDGLSREQNNRLSHVLAQLTASFALRASCGTRLYWHIWSYTLAGKLDAAGNLAR